MLSFPLLLSIIIQIVALKPAACSCITGYIVSLKGAAKALKKRVCSETALRVISERNEASAKAKDQATVARYGCQRRRAKITVIPSL